MEKQLEELISLNEERVLITGAASGIGRATAMLFAQAGADLILIDVNKDGLRDVKKKAEENGVEVLVFYLDLSDKKKIDEFWEEIREIPSILINNAGIYPFQDYLKVDEEALKKVMDINLNSIFWMTQHFIQNRMDSGGIIVNVSSIETILPFKENLIPYSMSKAGIISLTRSVARDYGKDGFRANVILPGAIKTEGTRKLIKKAVQKMQLELVKVNYLFNQRICLRRWGSPEEAARVILFLASGLSSYVQGAVIPVDGGFLSS